MDEAARGCPVYITTQRHTPSTIACKMRAEVTDIRFLSLAAPTRIDFCLPTRNDVPGLTVRLAQQHVSNILDGFQTECDLHAVQRPGTLPVPDHVLYRQLPGCRLI